MFSRLLLTNLVCAISLWSVSALGNPLVSGLATPAADQEAIARSVAENRKQMAIHFARTHIGIEILTAGSTTSNLSSLFGHSLIRLIDQDDNPMNDTVIGFEMLTLGRGDEFSKGLFLGGYEVVPKVMPFSVFLVRYVLNAGRSLERVILPSTPQNIEALKKTVQRIMEVSDIAADYNFFSNNCLTVLRNVLAESGYPMPKVFADVPTTFTTILNNTMMTYAPALSIPSVEGLLYDSICEYLTETKKTRSCSIHDLQWRLSNRTMSKTEYIRSFLKDEEFWTFLKGSSPYTISLLVNFWPYSLDRYAGEAESVYEIRNRLSLLKESIGSQFIPPRDFLKRIEEAAYWKCALDDANCRSSRHKAASKIWSEKELNAFTASFSDRILFEKRRALQLPDIGKKAIAIWLDSDIVKDMALFNH